jgi:hypothetical protein
MGYYQENKSKKTKTSVLPVRVLPVLAENIEVTTRTIGTRTEYATNILAQTKFWHRERARTRNSVGCLGSSLWTLQPKALVSILSTEYEYQILGR